ncbi:ATP-binding protein [Corallococcus macrosporus]|uniref:ATP-binding protein n=1 Tax=Corallococcus macrosporus TaxID=35 RepID=A0ABS3DA10_9BACT|nr:ATP-binding protein [Corallococcus macrosporus]MBN8228534.1 ATP-binding protein [Corallococcus macrosporus]
MDSSELILAAEECEPDSFFEVHRFSRNDERVISKLISHGPVLLQGGRGSGKSALMLAAAHRLSMPDSPAFGVYLSLRHLPLLRTSGADYERLFCELLVRKIQESLVGGGIDFSPSVTIAAVQQAVANLSSQLGRRIVLFFDDAAHIGREASLADFFDIFRTLASSTVSCKATIYPGVTQFGNRFDVYNDATVVDVIRNEEQPEFGQLFAEIIRARWPNLARCEFAPPLSLDRVAGFLAQSVVGNMRGFVFACNDVIDNLSGESVGLKALGDTMLRLATNYYWPLFEEVAPKLGKYVPMVDPSREIAEAIFQESGAKGRRSVLVHRDIISRLSKPFEILEYVGFVSRREASRAMKSGGRGTRFVLNLCNLLEQVPGSRLTSEIFERWHEREEPIGYHVRGSKLSSIELPLLAEDADLLIFNEPVEKLAKSRAYPYGLTSQKIAVLREAGIVTVGQLANASEYQLKQLDSVGDATLQRFRNVVAQAIWM